MVTPAWTRPSPPSSSRFSTSKKRPTPSISIERAWRAKGVTGPLIDTDINGDARMDPALAALVLEVLHEQEEADPLELHRAGVEGQGSDRPADRHRHQW